MPTYKYKCEECEEIHEKFVREFKDRDVLPECTVCKAQTRRVPTCASAFNFTSGGFSSSSPGGIGQPYKRRRQ